jgi:predicted HAD superfamily phosphohydrolase
MGQRILNITLPEDSQNVEKLAADIFARSIASELGRILSDTKIAGCANAATRAAEIFYAELRKNKGK